MIDLQRHGAVYTLTMDADENRWNTAFVRAFDAALDEISAGSGPAALVTTASSAKFFSNGLDLDWVTSEPSPDHPGGDRTVFGAEFMALMARLITFEIPTVAAVNGHAFGAGFMTALCHDVRLMRADRGYLCANELQLGMAIPTPELALFHHKLPQHAFFETVQLARRWTGPDAATAGIVQGTAEVSELLSMAQARAEELAPLANRRDLYGDQKERLFGHRAALRGDHGAAHMLRNPADYH